MYGSETRKIIIAGADHPTGLGMARAMSAMNFHITGVCRSYSPSCRSNVWDELIYLDDFDKIVGYLEILGEKTGEKAVLFPASDDLVKRISDHRNLLETYYLFNLPEKKVVDCFLDKTLFHEWALENGFRVPSSYVCKSHEEIESCLDAISFPVIIKPFEKSKFWDLSSPCNKTFHLRSREQLENIPFDLFSVTSKVLLQQYIPGGDGNVYFCLVYYDMYGNKIASYPGRKLLQWPPLNGSTAVAIGEHNEEVERVTNDIFLRARFKGLGSLEFKKDETSGLLYIIEPTIGRNDFQSGIAVKGGVNLPAIALADLSGDEIPDFNYKRAVWINEEGLVDNFAYNRRASLDRRVLLRLFHFRMGFSLFSIFDLVPVLSLLKIRFGRLFKKKEKNNSISCTAASKTGSI